MTETEQTSVSVKQNLETPALEEAVSAPDAQESAPIPMATWYALGVLTLINMFSYMDRVALGILMQSIKVDLNLTDAEMGLLMGLAFALFYATMGIPLAWLADRTSRVKLISVCLGVWSVMTALTGLARNFPQMFITRMGVGIGEAGCVPPAHSAISDYFPRDRRPLAISIFQTGSAIGVSGGLLIVGQLGDAVGWRASLQFIGLAGIPVALLAFFTLREPQRPKVDKDLNESPLQAILGLIRRPALVNLVVAHSIASICTYGIVQWLPTFLIRSFEMSMASVGLWLGLVTAVSGVSGMVAGGVIASRLLPRDVRWELWLPALSYVISIPIFILMILSPSAWMVLVVKIGTNFVMGAGTGVALSAVQSFTEPHRRAIAISLVMFISSLSGMGVGPYIIGALSDFFEPTLGVESLRYALLVSVAMLGWALLHMLYAVKRSSIDRVN